MTDKPIYQINNLLQIAPKMSAIINNNLAVLLTDISYYKVALLLKEKDPFVSYIN